MTDFDKKSIPILDDIIPEKDSVDDDEIIDLTSRSDVIDETDTNFDLFADEFAKADAENEVIETEPELGNIDQFIESDSDDPIKNEITDLSEQEENAIDLSSVESDLEDDEIESALIDYRADESDTQSINPNLNFNHTSPQPAEIAHTEGNAEADANSDSDPSPLTAEAQAENAGTATGTNQALSSEDIRAISERITTELVERLLPELTEHLRLCLNQALAEKVPEIINDLQSQKSNS